MSGSAVRYEERRQSDSTGVLHAFGRCLALASMLTGLAATSAALAQPETTIAAEHGKLLRAPQALGVLGSDLFVYKVNL